MTVIADSIIEWGALFDVIWISAVAGRRRSAASPPLMSR
jgi:hypothetical protein